MESTIKVLESKKLVSKYGKTSEEGKIMKNLFPEQVYLYAQLLEIDLLPLKTSSVEFELNSDGTTKKTEEQINLNFIIL